MLVKTGVSSLLFGVSQENHSAVKLIFESGGLK